MSYMYTYKLVTKEVTTVKNDKGNFVTKEVKKDLGACRHSIKTNREFKGEDFKTVVASYIVYCPLDNIEALNELKVGQKVYILDYDDNELANGSILGKNKGYFNFRIWL